MRARVLLPLGIVAAFALALASYAPASECTQPYCPSHTLTVHKAGSGSGTVTSSPAGIACGAQCSAPYEEKTKVTLTAQPAPGSTFVGWSGGGCSGKGKCVLTIAETDVTVTATFDAEHPPPPNEFTLGKVRHPETGVVTIQIKVPGPGTIEAAAHLMRSLRGKAKAAGTYRLTLRLTRRGMQRLERSHGRQLRTRVTFAFTPTGGETATKLKKIIFRVVRRHHGGRKHHRARVSTVRLEESAAAGKAVVASTATIKPATASIRLFCNGPQSCQGNLKLLASGNALLGSSGFELEAGASRVLHVKLTGRGKKLLGAKKPPNTRAAGTGLHPHAVKLKFAA